MIFRTVIEPREILNKIDLKSSILTIGSCFSDTLGDFLIANKVHCCANPYGNTYNPVSIANLIDQTLKKELTTVGLIERNGQWFHFDFHSENTSFSREELVYGLKEKINSTADFLSKTDFLTITLGTAFVHRSKSTGEIVNNCHKIPNTNFDKELLSTQQVVNSLEKSIQNLLTFNPNLQIILTVSPVRHTKEGLENNQLSKSILRVACSELTAKYQHVTYFASYEIMMDDLRDYRFYEEDMIHVNEVGKKYILTYFKEHFCTENLRNWIENWTKIKQKMDHRPFNVASEDHQRFLVKLRTELKAQDPYFDLNQEISTISSQIL